MKNRIFLLIPISVLLIFALFMIPVKAASVTDPEGDIIGVRQWTDGEGNPKIDCDWEPTDASMIDIESIEWVESGGGIHYNVTITFFGTPNATLIADGNVIASIFFLVNGSTFPEDLETETPIASFNITSVAGGTVMGNETTIPEVGVMTIGADYMSWEFNKSLVYDPVALENWDLMAAVMYQYTEENNTYAALDHYNFDYLEDALTFVCALLNLQIPGYSLIGVGIIAVITVGIVIQKRYKK